MLVLVLGIFFIQKIFTGGSDAIDIITTELQSQAQKLFARDETARVVIIPVSREISLKRGDNPKGFAFSVRNNDIDEAEFSYQTLAQDVSKCGISFTKETAEGYLLGGSGSFSLGGGDNLEIPVLVRFVIPESAPPCTILYKVEIKRGTGTYATVTDIAVTIR